jgi:hypothetical protein
MKNGASSTIYGPTMLYAFIKTGREYDKFKEQGDVRKELDCRRRDSLCGKFDCWEFVGVKVK